MAGLLAFAALAIFLAHPLRETHEPKLGVLDFGPGLLPSLLCARFDVFFEYLGGLGAILGILGKLLRGAHHELAKKTHTRLGLVYRSTTEAVRRVETRPTTLASPLGRQGSSTGHIQDRCRSTAC